MLTRARMRDRIAKRTGLPSSVVAQVLDSLEDLVREELLQQGEVVFRDLFRIVSVRQRFPAQVPGDPVAQVERLKLSIRPVTSMKKKLSAVLAPR